VKDGRTKHALMSFIICAVKAMKLTRAWTEHVMRVGEMINAYRNSVGKPEKKRLTERQGCRCDNIKMAMVWIRTAFG
jgi:hypothetical protein